MSDKSGILESKKAIETIDKKIQELSKIRWDHERYIRANCSHPEEMVEYRGVYDGDDDMPIQHRNLRTVYSCHVCGYSWVKGGNR
jgi:rubrerythrin